MDFESSAPDEGDREDNGDLLTNQSSQKLEEKGLIGVQSNSSNAKKKRKH